MCSSLFGRAERERQNLEVKPDSCQRFYAKKAYSASLGGGFSSQPGQASPLAVTSEPYKSAAVSEAEPAVQDDAPALDPPAEEGSSAQDGASPRASRLGSGTRVLLALLLIVACVVVGKATGLDHMLSRERVKTMVEGAGALGLLAYLAIFSIGQLVGVPGLVFVAAGILIYGKLYGAVAGLLGAVVAMTISFLVVRGVGGQPLGGAQNRFMGRILAQLDERPIRAIALLRLVFWLAPPVNYALALSKVRLRDFILGSVLGLLVPIGIATFFFDWLFG